MTPPWKTFDKIKGKREGKKETYPFYNDLPHPESVSKI